MLRDELSLASMFENFAGFAGVPSGCSIVTYIYQSNSSKKKCTKYEGFVKEFCGEKGVQKKKKTPTTTTTTGAKVFLSNSGEDSLAQQQRADCTLPWSLDISSILAPLAPVPGKRQRSSYSVLTAQLASRVIHPLTLSWYHGNSLYIYTTH